jgi:hypothetical protein
VSAQGIQQICLVERLAKKPVTARNARGRARVVKAACGHSDNDGGFAIRLRSDLARGLPTIHDRHPQIHPDEMWTPLLANLDGLAAIAGFAYFES